MEINNEAKRIKISESDPEFIRKREIGCCLLMWVPLNQIFFLRSYPRERECEKFVEMCWCVFKVSRVPRLLARLEFKAKAVLCASLLFFLILFFNIISYVILIN